ncbi:hypothetical protein GPECTOR_6g514 [Gonium pectorale]|uniref:26S proteasome regulatory subunit RPN2 C-terminal domain-containing protein n=1 Tax=Gonium pectorale TaxID=33097 RepID=A0A150GUP2_GONPE|nr:hypothetical protein GPECTOR_6g514 [Gonium pectorale]|eukprot:KXZ53597.1 hypothetical protein GPECTOR_6g514 [Gonium pectorale]
MAPYLPRAGAAAAAGGGSPYSEGGALYALGLIYANHGADIRPFLLESLRGTSNEVTQHGACLGLGLAALGTDDDEAVEDVKNVLYSDSAVAGEAAGIALGLLGCGGGGEKVAAEALAYAHDTQHEKIIRGVALGLALMQYGREEAAESLIEQMTRDADPIIRYGGMYVIGMAYRGTDNNGAVQKLLSFAVSDVSDDVRRAAVLCLGFVLMGVPQQCPRIVMCKMGAIVAAGILDAGGRNATIGLRSRSGYFRRTSVVGLAVFTQYWYWYPLLYFVSLAFQPTALIALNADLRMPKTAFDCNCKPSLFAYPPPLTAEVKEAKSKVPTAVLSTTHKAAERQRKKAAEKEKAGGAGGDAAKAAADAKPAEGGDKMETDEAGAAAGGEGAKKAAEPEPASYSLENPARVVAGQRCLVSGP